MFDLINEIWQTMRTNKLRTALTGLAVAWGIFMLIILLGISKGVLTSFQSSSLAQNPNKINVYPGNTSMPYKGLKEDDTYSCVTGIWMKSKTTIPTM